jgi:hypothetical protein
VLLQPPAEPQDSIRVALTEPVDPAHAPRPRNDAERVLFAQLYETLVRIDCTGRTVPGLARAWTADSSGNGWTLTLRDSARFWSGAPVSANGVIAAWRAAAAATDGSGALAAIVAAGAVVRDERTLHVALPDSLVHSFPAPAADAPLAILAARELAIVGARSSAGWPDGTARFRIATEQSAPGMVTLAPTSVVAPRIIVHLATGADPRDLLDEGADLLFAERPSVVQYATTRPRRVSVRLPWDRTYVLLLPARARTPDSTTVVDVNGTSAMTFRASLADAVHADARAATPPFWWSGLRAGAARDTPGLSAALPAANGARRIVYSRDDTVARDLAERLVALAGSGRPMADPGATPYAIPPELLGARAALRATGLDAAELTRALRQGAELGYVMALPNHVVAPLLAEARLSRSAPWLAQAAALDRVLVPLVDVRRTAIVHQDALGLAADGDGTPIILTHTERAP